MIYPRNYKEIEAIEQNRQTVLQAILSADESVLTDREQLRFFAVHNPQLAEFLPEKIKKEDPIVSVILEQSHKEAVKALQQAITEELRTHRAPQWILPEHTVFNIRWPSKGCTIYRPGHPE